MMAGSAQQRYVAIIVSEVDKPGWSYLYSLSEYYSEQLNQLKHQITVDR